MYRKLFPAILIAAVPYVLISCGKNIPHSAEAKTESSITVQTVPVTLAPMAATLKVTGALEGIREATVQSETQGRILSVVRTTGDRVSAGSPVIKVDDELKSVAVRQAQANRMSAEAAVEKAQLDLSRTEQLVRDNAATKNQLELAGLQVKSAQAALKGAEAGESLAKRQLTDATIKAPINGIISARFVNQGETVAPGTRVVTIVDDSRMKLRINVNEIDVPNIKVGDKVSVTVDAVGNSVPGSIVSISGKADMAHAYEVEVDIANSGQLKSGMFARAEIQRNSPKDVPVVPNEALITTGSKTQVYAVKDGIANLRAVRVGASTNEKVEIVDGLQPGDVVVTYGQNNLHDGARVSISK